MKIGSTEHTILKLLYKFSGNRLTIRERLTSDGSSIDIAKVESFLSERGINVTEARNAFQSLRTQGFVTAGGGVTASGIAKLSAVKSAWDADVAASSIAESIATGFGSIDDVVSAQLMNKEY